MLLVKLLDMDDAVVIVHIECLTLTLNVETKGYRLSEQKFSRYILNA